VGDGRWRCPSVTSGGRGGGRADRLGLGRLGLGGVLPQVRVARVGGPVRAGPAQKRAAPRPPAAALPAAAAGSWGGRLRVDPAVRARGAVVWGGAPRLANK
jgi:hypothetical protein